MVVRVRRWVARGWSIWRRPNRVCCRSAQHHHDVRKPIFVDIADGCCAIAIRPPVLAVCLEGCDEHLIVVAVAADASDDTKLTLVLTVVIKGSDDVRHIEFIDDAIAVIVGELAHNGGGDHLVISAQIIEIAHGPLGPGPKLTGLGVGHAGFIDRHCVWRLEVRAVFGNRPVGVWRGWWHAGVWRGAFVWRQAFIGGAGFV